nr:hypothetical protein [Micromonospora sp. DSM 115978]
MLAFFAVAGTIGCSESGDAPLLAPAGTATSAGTTNVPANSEPPTQQPTLSVEIVLDLTTVTQGDRIPGSLVATNRSTEDISFTDENGCRPALSVALQSAEMRAGFAYALMCEMRPIVFPPGTTSSELSVPTRYTACSDGESPAAAIASPAPPCEQGRRPPFP